jgi:pimeloyl-ACP methyl ester carboxylesterase
MGRVIEMPLPRLGETMEEGRIGTILKKPGEAFRRGETLLEVESDKTTVEVPALQDGILIEWLVASDQLVPVECAIARIEIEGEAVAEAKHPKREPDTPSPALRVVRDAAVVASSRPRASTAARAEARRRGIDLARLAGTGRNGRITRADLAGSARPSRSNYHTETPFGQIFFRDWLSQGPQQGSVLLLHGLFADSQSFTMMARKLAAKGYRTIAPDLPGHGETSCPATSPEAMADALKASLPPGRFHVVGHSFGAAVAASLVERAESLTLLCPAGCGEEISHEFVCLMLSGQFDRIGTFLGDQLPPEAMSTLADDLARHGPQRKLIAGEVESDGRQKLSILPKLAETKIPVQAVFMRDDSIIPSHHALNMPFNVSVHLLQAAGHLPHWRAADQIVELITAR